MVKDVKREGGDAVMKYGATMNQVSLNLSSAPAPIKKSSKARSIIEQRIKKAEQDAEVAAVIADIKKNGPTAAFKYAEDEALMQKLDFIFGDVSATAIQAAENRMKQMIERPHGGVGSLDETYGEEKPEYDRMRLLGGGKRFGIISCCICFWCFPCGLLAICFPCDEG